MTLASWAAASAGVEEQDLAAAVRQLNTGDWSARIRTVHEIEYMREDGIPALTLAAEDGDWQVRMAAVNALGPLGPKATLILKSILKNEPCPVVRLIALHNLGSLGADGAEEQSLDWMFSASSAEINACRDQPAPGRAPWAATIDRRLAKTPAVSASKARPRAPAAPAETEPESHEVVVTPDVPQAAAAPPAPKAQPSPAAPTKNERYAELDSLLAETTGTKGTLGDAPAIGRSPAATVSSTPEYQATTARANKTASLPQRRANAPETLSRPVVTTPAPEGPVEGSAAFESAGSKAPHDALPDLILGLKSESPGARARAADVLGSFGAESSPAVPALMRALKDKNPRVRASASLALGNIGARDAAVVPLLVKALKDKNLDVRYAATLALSRIDTPAARAAFRKHIGEDARRAIEHPQPAGPNAD